MKRLCIGLLLIVWVSLVAGCGTALPRVEGMEIASAAAALQSAGLQVGKVTYDDTAPEATGTVVAQVPAAGQRAKDGSSVDLTLAGLPPVTVPNLVDLDKAAASDTLLAAGLSVGELAEGHSASVAVGSVISQAPGVGAEVPAGSAVALVVSTGPAPVRIPNVKGRSEARARERLEESGFAVKILRARSSEDEGTVIAQRPSTGRALPGKTITITVASGGASDSGSEGSASGSNDDAAARAFAGQASGIQLSGTGSVSRVLADDNDGDRHQRFILRLASGQTLLIAHNIDIAPRVPSLAPGDSVAFFGEYEWNAQGGTVHWTHHDPSGDHQDGWLKRGGSMYQ